MKLVKYLLELENLQSLHPIILEMENYSKKLQFPILNRLSARLLSLISISSKAKHVFEIGSGFGYSAMWIAIYNNYLEKIHLTDFKSQNLEMAREFFRIAGFENKIETHLGDGLKILEEFDIQFDLVFNDAQKVQYPRVLEIAKSKLKIGGILISDNTLWHEKVLSEDSDEETLAIKEFNRRTFSDRDFISSFIPIGDGLIISVRVL